jgi:transposase-like protein
VQRLNRYYRRSRIAEAKFRLLARHFALDLCAADAAQLTGISHRSAITIFGKIRRRVAEECERQSPFKNGEVEVDESYFGPHRVRGKRGRGAGRKTIVFGLLKRDGKVYTEVVPDCKKATLQAIIRGRVSADAVIPAWRQKGRRRRRRNPRRTVFWKTRKLPTPSNAARRWKKSRGCVTRLYARRRRHFAR